jgi:hypothetical protein
LPYTAKWFDRPVPSLKNNLGWAGAGSVLAVSLAIGGKTGVTNALEGENGMWRMAGSDRWDLREALFDRPAVMRVGFKAYPACWHLQSFLKAFSILLEEIPAGHKVAEIVISGPPADEKFCKPEIKVATDTAFSLPAEFSLMMSGIEPGPKWAMVADGEEGDIVFQHRDLCHYRRSAERSLTVRTDRGAELQRSVAISNRADMSPEGLDEAGVLAKHERLAASTLKDGVADAFNSEEGAAHSRPIELYQAYHQVITDDLS